MASGSPARHKAYLNTAPRPKRRFRPEPFPFSLQRTRLLSPVVPFVILRRRSQYRSLLTFKARRMQHGMPLKGPAPTPMIKGRVRHCAWTGCVGLHLPPGQTRFFYQTHDHRESAWSFNRSPVQNESQARARLDEVFERLRTKERPSICCTPLDANPASYFSGRAQ